MQLVGQDKGDVRRRSSWPSSPLVLWCRLGVSGSLGNKTTYVRKQSNISMENTSQTSLTYKTASRFKVLCLLDPVSRLSRFLFYVTSSERSICIYIAVRQTTWCTNDTPKARTVFLLHALALRITMSFLHCFGASSYSKNSMTENVKNCTDMHI